MFKTILEYQALDEKLSNLERDYNSLPERDNLNKLASLVKENQAKLVEVDGLAKKAIIVFEKTKSDFENIKKQMENISTDTSSMTEVERTKSIEKLEKFTLDLSNFERNLSSQVENIKSILNSFETYKNNVLSFKQKYKDAKEKCSEIESKFIPQIKEIKAKLALIEEKVEPNLMNRYKQIKQDQRLPVIIANNGSACGGCSMSIPAALMTKLKDRGYIECEQCRRIIYNLDMLKNE